MTSISAKVAERLSNISPRSVGGRVPQVTENTMNENLWRKAEANQLMRETRDRIRKGVIGLKSVPNILVKVDGVWKFPPVPSY